MSPVDVTLEAAASGCESDTKCFEGPSSLQEFVSADNPASDRRKITGHGNYGIEIRIYLAPWTVLWNTCSTNLSIK